MDHAGLIDRFRYHPVCTEERARAHESVRAHCMAAAMVFEGEIPDGREKSLAITKLEEAMFWANAAIARQDAPAERNRG